MEQRIELKVNGEVHDIHIDPWKTLVEVLRQELGLTGTKAGCESGSCGTCTVIIDGKAVKSCLILAVQAKGRDILTVEGLAGEEGLHPLQQAFIDNFAMQCGYCTSGMLMSTKALLDENANPTEEDVRLALTGNLCRCGEYNHIVDAVLAAAKGKKDR